MGEVDATKGDVGRREATWDDLGRLGTTWDDQNKAHKVNGRLLLQRRASKPGRLACEPGVCVYLP